MMRVMKTMNVLAIGLWLLLVFPSPSSAGAPTDQIRATVDKVMAVLKDPRLKTAAKTQERREKLRQILYARFDFSEMAKRSLGSHWRRRSPKEQEEFVKLFTTLLEKAYVDRIESFNNENFTFPREKLDGRFGDVESRIMTQKGEDFTILYRTQMVDGEWRVYDVVIENISLVNNYRSQFNRVITNSSYEELVQKMKEKEVEVTSKGK